MDSRADGTQKFRVSQAGGHYGDWRQPGSLANRLAACRPDAALLLMSEAQGRVLGEVRARRAGVTWGGSSGGFGLPDFASRLLSHCHRIIFLFLLTDTPSATRLPPARCNGVQAACK